MDSFFFGVLRRSVPDLGEIHFRSVEDRRVILRIVRGNARCFSLRSACLMVSSCHMRQQHQHGASTMLSPEAKQAVATELKRFAGDLNLSDDQKSKLQTALENARERIDEIRKSNPDMTRADVIAKLKSVRGTARERLVNFLTPEQLGKWDKEMAKAKSFLGIDS